MDILFQFFKPHLQIFNALKIGENVFKGITHFEEHKESDGVNAIGTDKVKESSISQSEHLLSSGIGDGEGINVRSIITPLSIDIDGRVFSGGEGQSIS